MKTKSIISVIISFMIVSIPICFLAFLDRKDLSQLTGNGLLKTKAYEVNLMFFIIAIILLLLLLGFWWIKFLQKDLESYIGIHHLLWIVFFILYGINKILKLSYQNIKEVFLRFCLLYLIYKLGVYVLFKTFVFDCLGFAINFLVLYVFHKKFFTT